MVSVILYLFWVMKVSVVQLKQGMDEGSRGQDNHWHLSYALQYFKSHFLHWDEYSKLVPLWLPVRERWKQEQEWDCNVWWILYLNDFFVLFCLTMALTSRHSCTVLKYKFSFSYSILQWVISSFNSSRGYSKILPPRPKQQCWRNYK